MSITPHPTDDEIVDLEEHFAANKEVPTGKKYRIKIDGATYIVDVEEMTGRQILGVAGKTPETHLLRQKLRGGVAELTPDQLVSFVRAGVERFMTVPKEVTEGEGPQPRREFTPMRLDEEYLISTHRRWEAVVEGGMKILVMYDWPLPQGYNVATTNVHVRLSNGYPDTQIDMAYFRPVLARVDGRQINNLSGIQFDGQEWQQWSRHRTSFSAWRPGIDDLSTHMALVDDWLAAELKK